jgi:hypothetical protein
VSIEKKEEKSTFLCIFLKTVKIIIFFQKNNTNN